MKKDVIEQVVKTTLTCDGCDYLIGRTAQERDNGVTIEERMVVLRMPGEDSYGQPDTDDGFIEFHFHAAKSGRHDCFRYWSHSQAIMTRSLTERGWDDEEIDAFLTTHLFARHAGGVGLTRTIGVTK